MRIKVAIAEDNKFLLQAIIEKLSFFPDFEVKIKAYNGEDLLQKLEDNRNIQVILMDIEMPIMDGIAATYKVAQKYPHIKVIMLTVFDDDEDVFRSIQAGANGYFLKEVDPKSLYEGIKDTLTGGAAMTPSIALKVLQLLRTPPNFQEERENIQLTAREIDVLQQISKGLTSTQISENLYISPKTVRKHNENIYKKLRVHSKLEAINKAKRNRII